MAVRPPPPSAAPRRPTPMPLAGLLTLALLFSLGFYLIYSVTQSLWGTGREINDSDFSRLIASGEIAKATIVGDHLEGKLKDPNSDEAKKLKLYEGRFTVTLPPSNDRTPLAAELRRSNPAIDLKFQKEPENWFGPLLVALLPAAIVIGLFVFFILPRLRDPVGGNFLSNYGKSPARRYEHGKQRVTFADVAGMETTKRELQEIVDFLREPERFQRLGAQVPKGVLLVGPPGTGKTLLAKAIAGEADVPFYSINGSEFIQMFVGVGASRVRDLFKTAKESAPCLIFIDEIDAVGRMRGAGVGGGSDEREQTLNQILSEMDGFQPNESVIVLAATNRPDVLDTALLRPGRFDRHVTIDRPTWQGRLAILQVHVRNKPLADDVDLESLARKMIGMTGADLRNLCNEAALLATREGKNKIDRHDFENAADRVLMGPLREEVQTPTEKRRTAYHEAGHALCALHEPNADPVFKVTIVPRGRALGVTHFLPEEDRMDHTQSQFMARLVTLMGGRAADRLVFHETTSGANSDLKQATRMARMMVTQFGMSDRLGPMTFRVGEEHVFLGKEMAEPRDFSEGTAQVIDEEVQRLLREADQRAYDLLAAHRDQLDKLADALIEREELSRAEIEQLLNVPPEKPPEEMPAPHPILLPSPAPG